MNKLFGVLIGILVCTSVAAADENDFRCLKSIGVKTPLRLQFVFQTDKPDVGSVIYQNGKLFKFEEDIEASTEKGCAWNKK